LSTIVLTLPVVEQAADLRQLLAARVHEEVLVAHAVPLRQAQGSCG
jgi:hypothetical protein